MPIEGNSAYSLDEPKILHSQNQSFDEYLYLSIQRADLDYDGPPSSFETGIKLIRVDQVDKENGSYEIVFWHWIKIN